MERVRGEFRKCDEVRAERRVKGLVSREDMNRCVLFVCFVFRGGGSQWV